MYAMQCFQKTSLAECLTIQSGSLIKPESTMNDFMGVYSRIVYFY